MLKSRLELQTLREECKKSYNSQNKKILVCAGTGCVSSGSLLIFDKLKEIIEKNGLKCEVELGTNLEEGKSVALKKSGCHGFCQMGPLVRIEPEGYLYTKVKLEDCEERGKILKMTSWFWYQLVFINKIKLLRRKGCTRHHVTG